MRVAGYNSPNPMKTLRKYGVFALVLLCAHVALAATPWTDAATRLAREAAAIGGPGAVAVSVRNASSLPMAEVPEIRSAFEAELKARGMRLVGSGSAAAEIQVTLSENLRGYVWVAEVRQGADKRVAIVQFEHPRSMESGARNASMVVQKRLLWQQDEPILDVLVQDADVLNAYMLVLDPGGVTIARLNSGRWQSQERVPITNTRPWPRDMRGRLAPGHDRLFEAYLPGVVCSTTSTQAGTGAMLTCRYADDAWPLAAGQSAFYHSGRNHFSGVLVPEIGKDSNIGPFFSAAALPRSTYTLWLFSGLDGRFRLADNTNTVTLPANSAVRDWGSDVAAVTSGCGAGTQVLAAGQADRTRSDWIRAYEIADREPVAVSEQTEFAGPVTALWAQADGKSAIAVSRNSKTGKYEAYSVSVACNQ